MVQKRSWKLCVELCCVLVVLGLALQGAPLRGKTSERWVSPDGNDFGPGSAQKPWRTLQHAGDRSEPGMTIHVLPGTYVMSQPIVTEKSGTAAARIRFISEAHWGARLVTTAEQAWANTGAYVDIEGFDMSAAGGNTAGLVHAQGIFDRVLDNRLHDIHPPAGTCPSGAGVMVGGGADFQTVSGNLVYNIGPPVAAHCNQMHGIYVATSHNIITNNLCFNNGGLGIHIWGSAPSHNLVVNNTLFANWRGVVVGSQNASPAQENYIANNIVYKHAGVGIYEQGVSGGNVYRNNLVYGNQPDFALLASRETETLRAEPRFVQYTGNQAGDYHLRPGSPAVGRGTADQAPETDLEARPRRRGLAPDIGAYQQPASATTVQQPASATTVSTNSAGLFITADKIENSLMLAGLVVLVLLALFWRRITDCQTATPGWLGRLSRHGLLFTLVLVTRIPLIGNFEGEPDSSRYVTGLHLWVSGDRANPLVYERSMSAGYYWMGAELARITHIPVQSYSLMLSIVSLCATLLFAAAVYELGRYIVGDNLALLCSAAFFISPSVWWMGIQPHPQALSAAFAVAALYAYLRAVVIARSALWSALSMVLLTSALLVKIDTVLLFPAFIGLLLFHTGWDREALRRLLLTAAMLATASVAFLLVRTAIVGTGLRQLQTQTDQSVVSYLAIPSATGALKQTVPMVLALGPALFLFAVLGVLLATRKFRGVQLSRWLLWLVTWCLPGWLFWFFIAGNNPRHVALSMLALLWLGVTGWVATYGHRTAATALVVAALLNFVSLPANSSTSYLLSPNVPGSARALRAREVQIRSLAESIATQGGTGCFVGTYTIPYLRLYLLQASKSGAVLGQDVANSWVISDRYSITCRERRPDRNVEVSCSPEYSLEYAADGSKHRFFGSEVNSSPFWSKLTVAATGNR